MIAKHQIKLHAWVRNLDSGASGRVTAMDGASFQVLYDNGARVSYSYDEAARLVLASPPRLTGIDGAWDKNPYPPNVDGRVITMADVSAPTKGALPTDSAERKEFPLYSGLVAYFPAALAQVANLSYVSNKKHNPTWKLGDVIHHARGVSGDHLDCVFRHVVDSREKQGEARIDELRSAAWRILAELQEECERQGAPVAPAAIFPNKES